MNQTQMILKHLQKNKGITSMEAISEYGITRLASRIHELRESGHNIQNFWEESVNRYGVKVKYVRYVLIKKDLLPDDTGWKKAYNKFAKWFK